MQNIDNKLKWLAFEEICGINGLLTDAERERLNFWALRPKDKSRDLFGQICQGNVKRYLHFLHQCVVPFTDYIGLVPEGSPFKAKGQFLAVEIYMALPWAENKKIIDHLAGLRDLNINDL